MVHWTWPRELDAPLDEALLSALSNPRDRATVLGLEECVRAFLRGAPTSSDETLTFPNAKLTYHRMLAHKVAQYYQLRTASIESQGKGSVVMASFVDGNSRPSLQQITPLAEVVPANTSDTGEYGSNESEHARPVSESWSEVSTSGPAQQQQHQAQQQQQQLQHGQPSRFACETPSSARTSGRLGPPMHPQARPGQHYPAAYDYGRQPSPASSGPAFSPMAYPYPGPMPGYAMAGNGVYMPMVPAPGAAGMSPYGMPMVSSGATAMYPAGYAPMHGYPPPGVGQDGHMMGQVTGMMAYVVPPGAVASGPVGAGGEQSQAYAHPQYQQPYGMAARPRPTINPSMGVGALGQPAMMSPHGSGPLPSPYGVPSHSGGVMPSPSSRVSSPHALAHPRVASPQGQPQHSRVGVAQPAPHPGYFASPPSSILNQQKSYPYGPGQPPQPQHPYPHQQQQVYEYQQHPQGGQGYPAQGYSKGSSSSGGSGMVKAPAGPASGTIRAMKGELMRMHHVPQAPQRSAPNSPQPQNHASRVRKPTVDVGEAAGDPPAQAEVSPDGEDVDGQHAQGQGGAEEEEELQEQPFSPNAQRLSPTNLAQREGGDKEAGEHEGAHPPGTLMTSQLGSLAISSRLRRTSTPNSAFAADLPVGSPLPTPVAMIKACTSPMRLRQSSSGACSPSYAQVQHRSSNSGSMSGRRFTVNGTVSSCEPKKEGAFGLKAAQAASAVAAAIILKPGLNGRSSPINLAIHCPKGVKRPPPESVLCPLSGKVMKDPVFLIASGLTYDRSSLEAIMQDGKGTCPTTGQQFDATGIVPNQHAKQVVQDWLRNNPDTDVRREAGQLSEVQVAGGCGSPADDKSTQDLQEGAGAGMEGGGHHSQEGLADSEGHQQEGEAQKQGVGVGPDKGVQEAT